MAASPNDKNLPVKAKLAAARSQIKMKSPYYRSALYRVRWVEQADGGGQGTLGMTANGIIFYNPGFIDTLSTNELAAAIVHELYHWLRDHHGRGKALGNDHQLWNMAGDLEINDDLEEQGYKLPGNCLSVDQFKLPKGRLMEEYYNHLRQQQANQQNPGSKAGKGPGKGQCGSCAGNPMEGEPEGKGASGQQPGQDPGGGGQVEGLSDAEANRIRKEVAEDVQNQIKSKGRGNVPGSWVRWAGDQLAAPKVNWRQKLSQAVKRAASYRPGSVVTHYTRPSRRQAGVGFGPGRPIMSAMRQPVPRVTVAVDTSGSMGDREMQTAMAELDGILKATGADVDFISCDAQVHEHKAIRTWQDAAKLLKGGGGTDFNPIFEAANRPRGGAQRPEVMIVVTDGCGPAPAFPPPGINVIWLLISRYRRKPCEWGECIEVDDGEEQDED